MERLAGVPSGAIASPDGRWIAAGIPSPRTKQAWTPGVLVFHADGTRAFQVLDIWGGFRWLSDSSGLVVGIDAPQRAPRLGVVDLDGRLTELPLQLAGTAVSRDGRWIVSDHQDGCCVAIRQREVWKAPRTGGDASVVTRATSPDPQAVWLLGIDDRDRAVYRDGDRILRVALSGGAPELLGAGAVFAHALPGGTSPDGRVIVARSYDPASWIVAAGDRAAPLDPSNGRIVDVRNGYDLRDGSGPVWLGDHAILLAGADGSLSSFDPLTAARTPLAARLGTDDVVLAHSDGRLLLVRGDTAVVVVLASGTEGFALRRVSRDGAALDASPLPGGGFLYSDVDGTYRID